MTYDAVYEAAVIAIPNEKWQERPLACVVLHEGKVASDEMKKAILDSIKEDFASWWLPDDIMFLDEIPKKSVGKFLKRALRKNLHEFFMKYLTSYSVHIQIQL